MTDENMTSPRPKRIVLCRGIYCNEDKRADRNFLVLKPYLEVINGDSYPPRVKFEIASCLSMCGAGPNLIIYPDNVRCHYVDEDEMRRIAETYLK